MLEKFNVQKRLDRGFLKLDLHPMPKNRVDAHEAAGDWDRLKVREFPEPLVGKEASVTYDSTRPDFPKSEKF